MNALIVGADKTPIFKYVGSSPFLFIDDGPLIDALEIPSRRKVVRFDVAEHHLIPLQGSRGWIAERTVAEIVAAERNVEGKV
jgi:hypothetical protein